tara:strand:- start:201 stop:566 length:366 start_codon:yes stop_codon:yes gene_type:complete
MTEVTLSKEEVRAANQRIIDEELAAATKEAAHLKYRMKDMPWLIEDGEYLIVLSMIKNRSTYCKFSGEHNRSKRAAYLLKLRGNLDNLMAYIKATEWADQHIYKQELKMTRALLYDNDRSN